MARTMAFLSQILAGLALSAPLFMLAAGLSLIFAATGIVNFAQGALALFGASLAWAALARLPGDPSDLLLVFAAVPLALAALGAMLDILLFRRLAATPFLLRCLATLALSLVLGGLGLLLWGPTVLALPRMTWLTASVAFGDVPLLPVITLIRIGSGLVAALVVLLLRRLHRTGAVALGTGLAGLAGALVLLDTPADAGLDLRLLGETFVVAAIGGLGSLLGALVAALLIGQLQAWGAAALPQATPALLFAAMVLVLAIRSVERRGATDTDSPASPIATLPIRPAPRSARLLGGLALLFAAAAPFLVTPALLSLVALALIAILFATSLQVVVGPGNMPSFGHAVFFGTGAYAAARLANADTTLALMAAPLAAGLLALVLGALVARLSAPAVAMVTLVSTQVAFVAAHHLPDWTGRGAVLRDIRPSTWASQPAILYWLILVLTVGGTLLLRRVMRAPFGYALRAARDDPARARSIGLSVPALRTAAFTLGGAAAGLAGGLATFARGGVTPTDLEARTSVDGLLILLLGGIQALSGPVIGALTYTGLAAAMPIVPGASRLLLGVAVLALVLCVPDGIAGASVRWWRRGT